MSQNGGSNNGGWEDLFSPLHEDEPAAEDPGRPAEAAEPLPWLTQPEAASELREPGPTSSPEAPEPVAPAGAPEPAEPVSAEAVAPPLAAPVPAPRTDAEHAAELYSALQADIEADAATGLTRRELRERREAAASGLESMSEPAPPAVEPTAESRPEPAAEPVSDASTAPEEEVPGEIPVPLPSAFGTPQVFEPSAFVPTPAVEEPAAPQEPAPWDPAPELRPDLAVPGQVPEPAPIPDRAPVSAPAQPADPLSESVAAADPDPTTQELVETPTIPVDYDTVTSPAAPPAPPTTGGFPLPLDPPPPGRRGGPSLRWLAWCIPLVLVLGGLTAAGVWAWTNHEDKIRAVLGLPSTNDYAGSGNGEPVTVTINQGDDSSVIAVTLYEAGVTKSWAAFRNLAIELSNSQDCDAPDPNNGCWPVIQYGNYQLQKQMSAQAALDALVDPANKLTNNLYIPEGSFLFQDLDIISSTTGISLEELQAAVADPSVYGAANPANSLEGYLYPDTYQLDGSETAATIIQRLVNTTFQKLDALGVAPENRHSFLTLASIVQRESGPVAGDMAKIARVFENRLAQGMKLQSDATVAYGAGNFSSVWNTSAQLADANNPYNTYVHAGLPLGPIGAPSGSAMDAAAHPADGPWLFFVTVNLKTGETKFSETANEHQRYVDELLAWCEASDENAAYCK